MKNIKENLYHDITDNPRDLSLNFTRLKSTTYVRTHDITVLLLESTTASVPTRT